MPSATPAAGHRMMTPPSGATVEMSQQPSCPTMFSKSIVTILICLNGIRFHLLAILGDALKANHFNIILCNCSLGANP
jgi:hypothetical protein